MSRGFTLVEAVVAMAIAALAVLTIAPVLSASARASARADDPLHAALAVYAASLARDAAQAWKYGAPDGVAPQTYTGTMYGGAGASPVPVSVTQTLAAIDTSSAQVTVTVSSGTASGSATAAVAVAAPLPGSHVSRPGLVPMPSPSPTP